METKQIIKPEWVPAAYCEEEHTYNGKTLTAGAAFLCSKEAMEKSLCKALINKSLACKQKKSNTVISKRKLRRLL
jgi:hypothetical protein